ncbi:MAG: HAD-IIA family hydrolase [Thermoprotei archaeon]
MNASSKHARGTDRGLGFAIDIDGVVKRGSVAVERSAEALRHLRLRHVPFILATNNSTKSAERVSLELGNMGIEVAIDEIFTSCDSLIHYLKEHTELHEKMRRGIYVLGEEGVVTKLREHGYVVTDSATEGMVVVGLDSGFNYDKLSIAMASIRKGAVYIATNTDKTYPSGGTELPGAGAMIAAVNACTGRKPRVMGKPSKNYFHALSSRLLQKAGGVEIVMVGDRPETDIRMANENGCRSVLVLTGVTQPEQVSRLRGKQKPVHVFKDLYEAVVTLVP